MYTSGHTSLAPGQVGTDVGLEGAVIAARESLVAMLSGVLSVRGILSDLDAVKVSGCVNASSEFVDHCTALNEASQIMIDVFGRERDAHARSALGFSY